MNTGAVIFRPVKPEDNSELAQIIRSVLTELKVPEKGTTYADPELDCMFETFAGDRAAYLVVEESGKLLGGGGIIHLRGATDDICELQKMYLLKAARGRGIGRKLLAACLKKARDLGFRQCYLETMSDMKRAQALYLEYGFQYLDERLGNTGHYVCPVWMIKDLEQDV